MQENIKGGKPQACIPYEECLKVTQLAKAYMPYQKLCSIYGLDEAMVKGTIFPELASSYCKIDKQIMRNNNQC